MKYCKVIPRSQLFKVYTHRSNLFLLRLFENLSKFGSSWKAFPPKCKPIRPAPSSFQFKSERDLAESVLLVYAHLISLRHFRGHTPLVIAESPYSGPAKPPYW